MRKAAFLIIILATSILAPALKTIIFRIPLTCEAEPPSDFVVVTHAWNATKVFKQNSTASLSFRPDNDWSILSGFEERIFLPPNGTQSFEWVKLFLVNVTNPLGNFTEVVIYLIITEPAGGLSKMYVFPDYLGVIDKGGLLLENGYPRMGIIGYDNVINLGIAQYEGNYSIECSLDPDLIQDRYPNGSIWIHQASPPIDLRLYETAFIPEFPAFLVMPLSMIATLLAVMVYRRRHSF